MSQEYYVIECPKCKVRRAHPKQSLPNCCPECYEKFEYRIDGAQEPALKGESEPDQQQATPEGAYFDCPGCSQTVYYPVSKLPTICQACGAEFEYDEPTEQVFEPASKLPPPLPRTEHKKSEWTAFLLGFFCGPLGMFYLGWRYGLSYLLFCIVYGVVFLLPKLGDVVIIAFKHSMLNAFVIGSANAFILGYLAMLGAQSINEAIDDKDTAEIENLQSAKTTIVSAWGSYQALLLNSFTLSATLLAGSLFFDGKLMASIGTFFIIAGLGLLASAAYQLISGFIIGLLVLIGKTFKLI